MLQRYRIATLEWLSNPWVVIRRRRVSRVCIWPNPFECNSIRQSLMKNSAPLTHLKDVLDGASRISLTQIPPRMPGRSILAHVHYLFFIYNGLSCT